MSDKLYITLLLIAAALAMLFLVLMTYSFFTYKDVPYYNVPDWAQFFLDLGNNK